jgi:cell division protein ZapA
MAEERGGIAAGYVTVEIYDQLYHLSGQNTEHIRELAARVDSKMRAVASHGRTVDSLRVAVMAALNLADELARASAAAGAGAGGPAARLDSSAGHARAANLTFLLDEVLEEELKTGS